MCASTGAAREPQPRPGAAPQVKPTCQANQPGATASTGAAAGAGAGVPTQAANTPASARSVTASRVGGTTWSMQARRVTGNPRPRLDGAKQG